MEGKTEEREEDRKMCEERGAEARIR